MRDAPGISEAAEAGVSEAATAAGLLSAFFSSGGIVAYSPADTYNQLVWGEVGNTRVFSYKGVIALPLGGKQDTWHVNVVRL